MNSTGLTAGLDAFAEQFRAQVASAGPPGSEHAVHFCLALGLQAAWALTPGDVVFEHPSPYGSRTDLRVREPYDLAIEVKYLRSSPGGSQPARPMHYGQLLADFNKLAQVACRVRLIVLAADQGYIRYIVQSGRSVLPLQAGATSSITLSSLARLTDTPRQKAGTHGLWRDLSASLIWSADAGAYTLLAWQVFPGSGDEQ